MSSIKLILTIYLYFWIQYFWEAVCI